ncbi:hypothetical protein [Alistipes sp.]|uniref:hypothetical protein n=1 Tax=Alistipes sp. TaxID=1872444 RepID=UPI0011DDFB1A|nr:hypothetical protein [Alistipes sp.]
MLLAAACGTGQPAAAWEPLPAIASGTPYGLGVSALYAAEVDGVLLAAGGANFPDLPAAEGGAKRCYDEVWMLRPGADAWHAAGRLPSPSAYGAAYGLGDRLIIAGGSDGRATSAAVLALRVAGDSATIASLPDLPLPLEQAAAAREGTTLYLAGGLSDGVPSRGVYACDAGEDAPAWRLVAELPEPLVQPVATAHRGRLYVWGGYDPATREARAGGYRYDPADGTWQPIGGLPDGGTLTGAAALHLPAGRLLAAGGVDRALFTEALRLGPDQRADYLRQPVAYYRFRPALWLFDPAAERWQLLAESPAAARAGAALAAARGGVCLLGGELKPGIRTPENLLRTDLHDISAATD